MSQLEGFYQQQQQQSFSNSPLNPQHQQSYPQQQPHQQLQAHQQQFNQGLYGGGGHTPGGPQGFAQFYNNQGHFQQQQQQQQQQQHFQPQRSVPTQNQSQQSPAPNAFNGLANGGGGSANDMMQSPFPQQQQQQQQQGSMGTPNQALAFSASTFPQSMSATAGTPRPQGFPQSTASPSQHANATQSPLVANQMLGQQAQGSGMGAPATPRAAQGYQQQQQQQQRSPHGAVNSQFQPSSPTTAVNPTMEKERMTLLLEINAELLQEINSLQAQGKGGAQNAQQAEQFRLKGLPDAIAAPEYLQTLSRLHANLGYCFAQSEAQNKPGAKPPHPPSYMRPPPSMPSLEQKYAKLRQLFPGWSGKDAQAGPGSNTGDGGNTTGNNAG